jgi:uncharacterized membrane protein
MIAAVYAALTWATLAFGGMLAWGPIQFRISEAAAVLAMFTPAAIPGLAIGSVVANLLNPQALWPFSWLDVVLGSLGTLLGAVWMWRFRRTTWLALLGPIVANALIIAGYLPILLRAYQAATGVSMGPILGVSLTGAWFPLYAVCVFTIGVGEAAVIYIVGLPLLVALRRTGVSELLGR